jgi:hypothetical protein
MSDIANELRERSLRAEQEGEPLALLDDAADEIERLRLTDEEREALTYAAGSLLEQFVELGDTQDREMSGRVKAVVQRLK